MEALPKNLANFAALSPLTFLHRAATVYSTHTSIIYNRSHFTWQQTYTRCYRLAAALRSLLHISKNDVVSVLAPNVPAMYEMHFAVPMAGAILNTINTRLDAPNIALILHHSEAKLLFVDYQLVPLASNALRHLSEEKKAPLPVIVIIEEPNHATKHSSAAGGLEYEELIAAGDPNAELPVITDEWDAISLNYTSGTTSTPKGVVYSHRSAYLSTLSLLLQWGVGTEPVYLWSLPMFHCNGWTFTWGIAARGGTNVCIRSTSAEDIYRAIADHGVTYMCCAPIVFNIILFDSGATEYHRKKINFPVEVLTGGAPPPPSLLEKVEKMGFHVTHAYGMTEATGPALVCELRAEWNQLPVEQHARLKARQGISVLSLTEVDVKETAGLTMTSVPRDGKAVGEIVLRGSSVMKGYFKNEKANTEAFRDGWFLTGDLAVVHPDGYVEIKDRMKDMIISGGENISSVEVEKVLHSYYKVLEAAVVAMPHAHWGETPCAFVAVKGEVVKVTEDEILAYCRSNMPRFMVPRKVVFLEELPKNSTGKIEKKKLREMARELKAGMVKSERPSLQGEKMKKKEKTTTAHPEQSAKQVLGMSRL